MSDDFLFEISSILFIGDYENNFQELYDKHKDKEDPISLCWIGCFYSNGKIVERNQEKANELFKTARELFEKIVEETDNDSNALWFLSNLYYNGLGGDQNYQKANEYLYKSAKLGNPNANIDIGDRYYWGDGINFKSDDKEAISYYKEALEIDPNSIRALKKLCNIYKDCSFKLLLSQLKENVDREKALENRIKELEKENREMKEHIELSPEGSMYFKLKEHFESLKR
jgi:tetratricopeptide (TPR) repeat protein